MAGATPPEGTTGDRLLNAAEELIVVRGLDELSMREVAREAGAGNVQAVKYWFGGKIGLTQALLNRHSEGVELHRGHLLSEFELRPPDAAGECRALTEVLVLPYAAKLDEGTHGAAYLRLMSDLLHQRRPAVEFWPVDDPVTAIARWRHAVKRRQDPRSLSLHRQLRTARFLSHELSNRAIAPNRRRDRVFVSDLIDMATGMLFCPVSEQTASLM